MIFRELSNAAFRFSLRRPGAEIMGGGRSNAPPPPPSRRWKSRGPAGRGLTCRCNTRFRAIVLVSERCAVFFPHYGLWNLGEKDSLAAIIFHSFPPNWRIVFHSLRWWLVIQSEFWWFSFNFNFWIADMYIYGWQVNNLKYVWCLMPFIKFSTVCVL